MQIMKKILLLSFKKIVQFININLFIGVLDFHQTTDIC